MRVQPPTAPRSTRSVLLTLAGLAALALLLGLIVGSWIGDAAPSDRDRTGASAAAPATPATGSQPLAFYAHFGSGLEWPDPAADQRPTIPPGHALAVLADPEAETRIDPDLESVLPRLDDPALRPVVVAMIADRDEDSAVRHELLSLLRRSADPDLDAMLLSLLGDPAESPLIRSYAAQHLAVNLELGHQPVGVDRRAVLFRALHEDPELMVRREALLGLARVGDEPALALARDGDDPLLSGMADLVLAIWQEQGWTRLAPQVPAYLDHPDDQVVVAAVALIATWRIPAGRDRLAALDGRGPRVDRAVALAVRRLDEAN